MALPWEEYGGTTKTEEGPWKDFQSEPWKDFQPASVPSESTPAGHPDRYSERGTSIEREREKAKRPPAPELTALEAAQQQGARMFGNMVANKFGLPDASPEALVAATNVAPLEMGAGEANDNITQAKLNLDALLSPLAIKLPEGTPLNQEAVSEIAEKTLKKPIVEFPVPTSDTVAAGIARGVGNTASGLITGENLAMLTGIGAAGKVVQQGASLYFGEEMLRGGVQELTKDVPGETSSQKSERITQGVLSLLMGGLAAKHGVDGRAPISAEERAASMDAARERIAGAAPGATPTIPEPAPAAEAPAPFDRLTPEQYQAELDRISKLFEKPSVVEKGPAGVPQVTTETGARPAEAVDFKAEAERIRTEWMEGRAEPTKPEPVTPGIEHHLRDAHAQLVSESPYGFPDVPLSDLLERAGFPMDAEGLARGKSAIKQLQTEGKMDLGGGDWSLANDKQRASAVIGKPGDPPAIYGKFREGAESPKAEELLPEQSEVALPKLDVKRSPFALGISPDSKVMKWLTSNVKRLFTATGDLPKETFESWIQRTGAVKEQSRKTAYAVRDLYSALKEEFGISTTETLTKGFEKVPREFVKKMNQALLGEIDINTLPERVRGPLQAMREHVDEMSFKLLEEGVVPEKLQAKVADNLGTYLTRSYRVFDDPKWAEKIPQDVRNKARDFILSELQKTDPAATPKTASAVMEAMLQDWKDQGSGALIKEGGRLGSKDLTSFIRRKDIPEQIRALMGEYHDPAINYTRSVAKMANLLGNQRFLNEVKAQGMGKFLFEDGAQPASHSALIAADGSSVMAPLNGLRTTPEIAAAFREFGKSDIITNPFLRAFATLSGAAKSAKTVGSAMTQARNALGQAYFFAMNGHFDLRPAAGAVKAVLSDLGAFDTPAGREAYLRYQRLGVVDQSTRASELRDIIRDSGLSDPGANLTEPGQIWARTAKKLTVDAAAKAYQITDDIGKIIGFENELARQKAIHPDWSQATLEATAAERIRNTYPTYSMVPEIVRKFRRVPFAPFASFTAETFRTAYHNLRYTLEDLRSSNPAQKTAGIQRLAGQLAVVGGGYALSAIARGLLGMNSQEEDDARRFMAPWDRDSQIMFTGKGQGESKFVNLSYVNPYSYLTDPVISVASGLKNADELDDVMLRSLGKLLQPFTSEDILASAAIDTLRNTTQTGARVYNPGDSFDKKLEAVMGRFYNAVEPGTLTRARTKIVPAIKGETDKTGRQPELTTEILNELTGFKQQNLDYTQAIGFKAREFKKADDDADTIFREVAARRGTVKPDEMVDAYKRAAHSKFNAWQSFYRDVQAARRRGVSDSAIRTAIEARGVSGAEAGAIMSGKFVAPSVSPSLSKQMRENKRTLPPGVSAEKQRADRLVLSGRF